MKRFLLWIISLSFANLWGMEKPIQHNPLQYINAIGKESTAARTREYKRKSPEPDVPFEQYLSHEQFFINYVREHVKAPYAQPFLDVALRLQRMIVPVETYFENSYWISNDGRDLRRLALDVTHLTDSKLQYAALIKDPIFMEYFTKYLAGRYPNTTDQLRAAIPFGLWPGATKWVREIAAGKRNFEEQWCKEISILQYWLDAGRAAQDNFYRDGVLFLIHALPDNDSIVTRLDSCIQLLRAHVGNRHPEILKALVEKGAKL